MKKFIPALIVIAVLLGCHKNTPLAEDTAVTLLQQEWINSVEEEKGDGISIYRPEGYKQFPLLRFRHRFIFEENGKGKTYVLAPNDAHYFESIFWNHNPDAHLLDISYNAQVTTRYQVLELNTDILKIKRL